jgi:hypothetical protein
MKLSKLITSDREYREYLSLFKSEIEKPEHLPIVANGLTGGASDVFLAESVKEALGLTPSPILILASSEAERDATASMLMDEGVDSLIYKPRDLVFYNVRASHDVDRERLSVLSALLSGDVRCIVSTPDAVLQTTIPRAVLHDHSIAIRIGEEYPLEELVKKLSTLGFTRTDMVDGKGQFSKRGDILDFWGGESENPIRIEFFGDEVDRMTAFDPITQRTIKMLESVSLLPATEVLVSEEARKRIETCLSRLIDKQSDPTIRERLTREKGVLEAGGSIDFRDRFLGLIYPEGECLLDYLDIGGLNFILGTNECHENEMRKRAFFDAISSLEGLSFDGECDLRSAIINAPNPGNNDGLTVIISDFFTDSDWKKAVDYLCYKKRQVLLVQVMTSDERDPLYTGRVNLVDSESVAIDDEKNMKMKIDRASQNAYEEAMRDLIEDLHQFCNSRGAAFVSVCTDQPIERVLFKELLKVGIMG